TLPMTLTRTSGNGIQVTVDSAACRDDHVVILAGALGDFSGYQWAPSGCAFPSGAGSGQITDTRDNAWYIALWVSGGGTSGHPGYSSSGERTWRAAGFCAVTGDDPGDLVCP
ncbi:MAG: hypothetical protein MUC67_02810, partial [Acidobacteria bacterium]|nr:hypothetical protein [Acidobacteriota bacterium]